ncbi:MAG: deoxyribonuclease V [candidate division KSB1 bacterium]|nr:deoxyribonuclease V [candidate division KSB1 bacterium]
MRVLDLHPWQVDYSQAVALQQELRGRVCAVGGPEKVRYVAGADVSFAKSSGRVFAAVVVYDLSEHRPVEVATAEGESPFPYIPGLLSFREAPILLRAFRKLEIVPDAVLLDGQGIAHPRRFGLASHIGLFLDLPCVGCAKSRLIGEFEEPGPEPGDFSPLRDGEEVIGLVLRTRRGVKPVFVSVGHKISLERAGELVLSCCTRFRLPEPVRLAHVITNRVRCEAEQKSGEAADLHDE